MAIFITISPVYDEFIHYLVEKATPQEIVDFKLSDKMQARLDTLTEKNKSHLLTMDETIELEQMLQFDLMLMELKAQALMNLHQS